MKHLARSISEICGTIALQAAHLATLCLAPEWEYPFPSRTLLRFLRPRLHVLRLLHYIYEVNFVAIAELGKYI